MLARTGPLPPDEGELGVRDQVGRRARDRASSQGGRLRLREPQRRDITPRYPELRPLGRGARRARGVLDGEVVAFDGGRPTFQKLQGRMHLTSEHAVRRLARSRTRSTTSSSTCSTSTGARCWTCPTRSGARALPSSSCSRPDVAGARAPRRRRRARCSRPRRAPGARGHHRQAARLPVHAGAPLERLGEGQEHPPHRRRDRRLAAGGGRPLGPARRARDRHPRRGRRAALRRPRRARGFTEAELARLGELLEPLARDDSPFAGRQPPKLTRFVEPRLVARVDFTERTNAGTLRQPSYKGLRDDVAPADVRFG